MAAIMVCTRRAISRNYDTHISRDSAIITQDADRKAEISCGVKMSLKQRSIRRAVNTSLSYGFIHIHTCNPPPEPPSLPVNGLLDMRFRLLSHSLICFCCPPVYGVRKIK